MYVHTYSADTKLTLFNFQTHNILFLSTKLQLHPTKWADFAMPCHAMRCPPDIFAFESTHIYESIYYMCAVCCLLLLLPLLLLFAYLGAASGIYEA